MRLIMKKLLTIILFLAASVAYAQPGCPSGNQNQVQKWKFLFSQCMEDSLFLNYAQTRQVAYVDQHGVLTTISFSQLLDSLGVQGPDGQQWSIQFNDSGQFGGSNNFLYNSDEGVFYVTNTGGDTTFSVNTQTSETRVRGTFSVNLPDSTGPIIDGNGNMVADSINWVWKGNGWYLLNRYNAPTNAGALVITSSSASTGGINSTVITNLSTPGPILAFKRARGSFTTPSVPTLNFELGNIDFGGYEGTQWVNGGASIKGIAAGTWAGTSTPAYIQFNTKDANNSLSSSVFTKKGGLSIKGTHTDTTFDLTVNGTAAITTTPAAGTTDQILTHNTTSGQVTQLGFAQGVFLAADSARSNIDALTLDSAMYTRVGNIVTVTGRATIDATATGTVSFYLSIPIASNMTSTTIAGVNSSLINAAGTVVFGTTQKVLFRYVAASAASQVQTYTYTYRIN